jgi:riboflavin kinase/FMN adenylyltransferase
MQIFSNFDDLGQFEQGSVVAIGNFDGVHLGHQKILNFLVNKTIEKDLISLVLTFSPHPGKITGKGQIKLLQTLEQKIESIQAFGVQAVFTLPFTKKFASLSTKDFIDKILIKTLNARAVIVGNNFRFGKNRTGDISILESQTASNNLKIYIIPSVSVNTMTISSSLIRRLILKGDIKNANLLLGKPYEIQGEVIKGHSRGTILGFPTANVNTENDITPFGVFLTSVILNNKEFPSLTNIGKCPTFQQENINIESHILDFKSDIYRKKIKINFIKKLRDEIKFESPDKLFKQIQKDLQTARKYFKSRK